MENTSFIKRTTKRKTAVAEASKGINSLSAISGCQPWNGTSNLVIGKTLTEVSKKHNSYGGFYSQLVDIQHNDAFTLVPIVLSDGPLKGCPALVLRPVVPFRLMGLPPEIRNMIYQYVFPDGQRFIIERRASKRLFNSSPAKKKRRKPYKGHGLKQSFSKFEKNKLNVNLTYRFPSSFSILRASRELLREAAPIAYGSTTFLFAEHCEMCEFLESLGSMRKHLRDVSLPWTRGWVNGAHGNSLELLADATKLRKISLNHEIVCDRHSAGTYSSSFQSFIDDILPLLKMRRAANPDKSLESVVDLFEIHNSDCRRCHSSLENNRGACHEHLSCGITRGSGMNGHCEEVAGRIRAALEWRLEVED